MKFIDKKQTATAHSLIEGFLQRNKILHGGIYTDDLYDNLGADYCPPAPKTKKILTDILVKEQDNRCCYCMRRLSNNPTERSLEHIIVNHPKDSAEYAQYIGNGSTLDTAPIVSSAVFLKEQVPPPPYPHSVAYENLLVSCAGHLHIGSSTPFCCNNKRCHNYSSPLPLRPSIEKEIEYRKNGRVVWVKETDTVSPTVEVLGLNDNVLRVVRHIWYLISSKGQTPTTCSKDDVIYEALGNMLDINESDSSIQTLFLFSTNEWYWNLLTEYDFFNNCGLFK